jgi:hypothetical protein
MVFAQAVAPQAASPWPDAATIVLIGGQIILIITSLGGMIIAIITHLRMTAVKEKQTEVSTQLMVVAKDTEAIKGHVNSEKTAAEGREAAKDREIILLREMINDKKSSANLLAQAAAIRTREAPIVTAPAMVVPPSPDSLLQEVAQNTRETAENTAHVKSEDFKEKP